MTLPSFVSALAAPFVSVAIVLAAPCAFAGPVTPSNFGASAVVTTFEDLPLDEFGNPSALLIGDNTYVSDDGFFHHLTGYGSGRALTNTSDLGTITITLGHDAFRVGAYVGAFGEGTATIRFYDDAHNLLGSVGVTNAAPGLVFAGWEAEDALIHSVEIQDTSANDFVLALDNVTTEVAEVPEPASLALLGAGLAGLVIGRRRSSRGPSHAS